MDLALQVVGEYDHVLNIARMAERANAVALSLADHYLYGADRERYTDPTYDSFVLGVGTGWHDNELATRVADHAAECLERFRGI